MAQQMQEAGARNSAADMKRIQQAHDLMAECGAMCDGKNAKAMKEARYSEARKTLRLPEAVSYDVLRDKIREALDDIYPSGGMGMPYCWVAELFDEYAIIELGDDYWQVPYTVNGEAVTLADKTQWQAVERQQNWVPALSEVMENRTTRRKAEALLKWLK